MKPFRGKPGDTGVLLSLHFAQRDARRIVNWVDEAFSGARAWGDCGLRSIGYKDLGVYIS